MARRERTETDDNLPRHSGLDDGAQPDLNDDNLPQHSGLDDGPLHDLNDDNLPQHSGLDDGPLHDLNDDNLPQHSGLDDGPLHDLNDDNLPRHSGLDDGPLHDLNDDDLPRHSGLDDGPAHDLTDDRLVGRVGDDHRDGGRGTDTAVFDGNRSAYNISRSMDDVPGRIHVSGADSGHDILDGIERVEFADRKVAFDLGAGEAAHNTAKLVGAAFGAASVQGRPDYIGAGLSLFDAGYSLHEVAELAAKAMGTDDNGAFVDAVYTNVVGATPTHDMHDYLESLLQDHGGTMTRGDLLAFAANTDLNLQHIDMVGLQQSGVEYM